MKMTANHLDQWTSKLNIKDAKEMLQKWREDNIRNPEKVRDLWHCFDMNGISGDEKWLILEQTCLAALDLYDEDLIDECLGQLEEKFKNSMRVKRLRVMASCELKGKYDDALKVYDEMIRADEANSILYKRKISILISQKKIVEAIRELVEYVKKFMNDMEAWLELCDLYTLEQDYTKAAFCMEELILTNPHNHLYHQRYADIQYTINTLESLEMARAYYSQALKLNGTNMRALYGLQLTATALSQQTKYTSQKRKENAKVAVWASNEISKAYSDAGANEQQLETIQSMVASLQINSSTTQ